MCDSDAKLTNEGKPAHMISLVTGASGGIGRAIAKALGGRGGEVHLVGRSQERLDAARKEIGSGVLHVADLCDDEAVARLAGELENSGGKLDVLVHAAGDVALGKIETAPVADLDRQYRINLRAPYVLTQALLPLLRAAGGQVVFVNSGAGQNARPGWGQYAMTKHGLRALADSLREEVAAEGIRVLTVYPGRTATPMQEEVHRIEGKKYDPGRFVQPDDIARQVLTALEVRGRAAVFEITIRPT